MADEFKVLVADDSHALRLLVKQILDENNITPLVYEAKNGNEAIEVFVKARPDMVIMDLMMPELNGLEAIKIIRKISLDTRILVLTTSQNTYDIREATASGVSDIVFKPFNKTDLANKITKQLKEKDLADYKQLVHQSRIAHAFDSNHR
jgi:CheY-like chemotaxis protein